MITRHGVAGAVLQSPPSLINSLIQSVSDPFLKTFKRQNKTFIFFLFFFLFKQNIFYNVQCFPNSIYLVVWVWSSAAIPLVLLLESQWYWFRHYTAGRLWSEGEKWKACFRSKFKAYFVLKENQGMALRNQL